MGSNKLKKEIMPENFLPNKVVVYFDVLRASMKDRIGSQGKSKDIITPENGRST